MKRSTVPTRARLRRTVAWLLPALLLPALASTAFARQEAWHTGWALHVDNDVLAPSSTDRDYTGGLSLTLSGQRAAHWRLSLQPALSQLNRLLPIDADVAVTRHSLETGITVFTPDDIEQAMPLQNDRPYASLIYLSNTQQQVLPERNLAWTTTLTLGVLGLDLAADLQRALHQATGSSHPAGWAHQISRGGEPTLRYSVARQQQFAGGTAVGGSGYDVTHTLRINAGYLTDVSWGMAGRIGRLATPWWSFNPQLVDYAEKSVPVSGGASELYLWGGFQLRARLYNAFLQGQFRDSTVRYDYRELEPVLLEAWLGVTHQFRSGLRLSYVLRSQSPEIARGPASRHSLWGGLIISRAL